MRRFFSLCVLLVVGSAKAVSIGVDSTGMATKCEGVFIEGECFQCNDLISLVQRRETAVRNTYSACETSAECVLSFSHTTCRGHCGAGVNKKNLQSYEAELKQISVTFCDASDYANKCGFMTPMCMSGEATCQAGVCSYSKTMKTILPEAAHKN